MAKGKFKKIMIIMIAILAIGSVVFAGIGVGYKMKLEKYRETPLDLPKNFTITAHTGCLDTEDNSLDSITEGIKAGANIVEFDLNFDDGGNPVLCHDEPKGGEVTLEQAFELLKKYPEIKANVDAKSCKNLPAVKALAEETGVFEQIFFTGIEESETDLVKEQCEGIAYYLNVDVDKKKNTDPEYLNSLVEKVMATGAVGINFNKDSASKELVDFFHEKGLSVSVWTVSKELEMYEILSLSPDNITTRKPDMLKEIVAE